MQAQPLTERTASAHQPWSTSLRTWSPAGGWEVSAGAQETRGRLKVTLRCSGPHSRGYTAPPSTPFPMGMSHLPAPDAHSVTLVNIPSHEHISLSRMWKSHL